MTPFAARKLPFFLVYKKKIRGTTIHQQHAPPETMTAIRSGADRRKGIAALHGVFYCTRAAVNLDDIARIAQQTGHLCRTHEEPDDPARRTLTVVCGSGDGSGSGVNGGSDRWEWRENAEANEHGATLFNRHILSAYEPAAAFQIDGYSRSLERLCAFLQTVLESYGGWVGYADDWVETYDARNIDRLAAQA